MLTFQGTKPCANKSMVADGGGGRGNAKARGGKGEGDMGGTLRYKYGTKKGSLKD